MASAIEYTENNQYITHLFKIIYLIPKAELIPVLKDTIEVSINLKCSNKPIKKLLKYLDIEFNYYDIKGKSLIG